MPKWDGLKPLPDHVIAPLLRALACIPRTADTRLLLVKRTDGRPPGWDRENDYDVVFRGRNADSDEFGRGFRAKSATDSD
jgi:hypothetical protein